MGLDKKKTKKLLRILKTIFFLMNMVVSLILFSAPLLIVILDILLVSTVFSMSNSPISLQSLEDQLKHYNFRNSKIDIPLISIARSTIIISVYSLCDGARLSNGLYLGITSLCSFVSIGIVSIKSSIFWRSIKAQKDYLQPQEILGTEILFVSSLILAVSHITVAYRTSCRERRKMWIYRFDLEAVSSGKNGFPTYHKLHHELRVN